MILLENGDKQYSALLHEIESGQIKIPQFQRNFVWDLEASAQLIDSILKGYPIGTFIYWRTNERLRSIRNIGGINLPEPKEGEYTNYVLDGQQRVTSLFAALKGESIQRSAKKTDDFSKIFIDLDASESDTIVITDVSEKSEFTYISVVDLMKEHSRSYYNQFDEKYDRQIMEHRKCLQSYLFKGINLKSDEIDVATDVFTRLNVGGKELTVFEIMVAKTFTPERNFDLAEKYQSLLQELKDCHYETIPNTSILQLISILIQKDCTKKSILRIDRNAFIDTWDQAINSLKLAVDFLRRFGIPVSQLLPYNAILVLLSYFFHKHPEPPTGTKYKLLEDLFWRVSLGFRYTSSLESKLIQDIEKVNLILEDKQPKYEWSIDISPDFLKQNGEFGTSRSVIKAILCLFSMQSPKSFNNDLEVIIDNSWLKIASSKNYHHFFPKAFMKKKFPEKEYWEYNHIGNITIVDDRLNKSSIRAKAPSVYISDFATSNENIVATMKTHFIEDFDPILKDDYDTFLLNRLQLISNALRERIVSKIAATVS